jgi:hypothetical protein
LGTENVRSKKNTGARRSLSARMISSSRRSGVASGSAASSASIRAAILSSSPANRLGARPRIAVPSGSRGSRKPPYSRSISAPSTSDPTTRPSAGQPAPVQIPGGSPCSATADR